MLKYLIPAIAFAFSPIAVSAGVEGPETYIQDDFDVAGITLGMQPTAVVEQMEKRGYKITEEDNYGTTRGPSFDEMVQIAAGDLAEGSGRDSWKYMSFRKGSDEGVHVRFQPMPTGTAAYEIYYSNMSPAMTQERFMVAVEKKYGRPRYTANGGGQKLWSDMKMIGGSSFDIDAGAIQLTARSGPAQNGPGLFQSVKGSLKLNGGKISQADAEQMAKDWTGEPETTF